MLLGRASRSPISCFRICLLSHFSVIFRWRGWGGVENRQLLPVVPGSKCEVNLGGVERISAQLAGNPSVLGGSIKRGRELGGTWRLSHLSHPWEISRGVGGGVRRGYRAQNAPLHGEGAPLLPDLGVWCPVSCRRGRAGRMPF